jgi:RNA polymerase sigma-70 factor (ECF subfamily)
MGRGAKSSGSPEQNELYTRAVAECGRMLDRLPAGYEADPDKRRDLRQEIHLQLWRSFGAFDRRCSLKTWTLRVAHNTAASYVIRERRRNAKLISFDADGGMKHDDRRRSHEDSNSERSLLDEIVD